MRANASVASQYTCPMHPQIVTDQRDVCAIGDVVSEPMSPETDDDENIELHDMRKRFFISLILTLPVFIINMLDMNGDRKLSWFDVSAGYWLQLALCTPVVFLCGWTFFQRAWISLKNRSLNMFTLVVVGVSVTYWYSVIVTLVPHVLELADDRQRAGGVYFESAAVITTFVLLGQYLELMSRRRTGLAIEGLLALTPSIASLIRPDGATVAVGIASLNTGDALQIRPGDRIAVDAWLLKAQSTVDESMPTREPALDLEGESEKVIGTVDYGDAFITETETISRDTFLVHIIEMVATAQRSQAPAQRLVDRIATYFVPSIFAIAAVTFLAWFWLGNQPALSFALVNAVAVLIIACPCALGLATPMSIMVATEKGAASGVLIKNAEALQKMSEAVYLVIDKTGTLTEGEPKLVSIVPTADKDEFEILSLAAAMEKQSEHPLARAIVKAASEKTVELINIESFQTVIGKGVRARAAEEHVCLGNESLMLDAGVNIDGQADKVQALRSEGQTVVYLGIDANCVALLGMVDPIRLSANQALRELRADGMKIVMMTGDNERTAHAIAKQLQLDDVRAGLLPQEKANYVKSLRSAGHIVAMAGDGINDALARAGANLGLAMGTGIDIAMNSAGIILVQGDLNGIVRARVLSKSMMRNIQQNLILAFAYNVFAIPLAAGVLYPSLHLLLTPMIASAAMGLSSFSVVANALRLRTLKPL